MVAARLNSFTAVATAFLVLVANLACVCRAQVASAEEPGRPAAHGCCTHESDGGGEQQQQQQQPADPDEPCRHCSGFAASFTAGHTGAGVTADAATHPSLLPPAPPAFDASAAALARGGANPSPSPLDRSASTLLSLRCALTL